VPFGWQTTAGFLYVNDTSRPGERDAIRGNRGEIIRTGARTQQSARELLAAREGDAVIVDNDAMAEPDYRGEHLRSVPVNDRFAQYLKEKSTPVGHVMAEEEE